MTSWVWCPIWEAIFEETQSFRSIRRRLADVKFVRQLMQLLFSPQMFYLSIIIYAWFGNGTKMPWAMHNARLNSRDFFALVLVNRSEACGNIRCIKSHQERDIYVSVVSMSYIENSINPKQSLLPPRWYALKKWCLTWNTNKQNCYHNEF